MRCVVTMGRGSPISSRPDGFMIASGHGLRNGDVVDVVNDPSGSHRWLDRTKGVYLFSWEIFPIDHNDQKLWLLHVRDLLAPLLEKVNKKIQENERGPLEQRIISTVSDMQANGRPVEIIKSAVQDILRSESAFVL